MGLIILLYGLLLGSFYNVVGLRVPLNQSIVKPRSSCPGCGHTLTAPELIPVLSYIIQGGKCSRCRERISPLYPLVEASTAILFLISYSIIGWEPELLVALTLVSLFVIIFVSDIKYMIIPDKVLLFFSGLFLLERLFIPLDPWWDSLTGSAIGFSLLLLIAVISKGGMGGGDIKLYALIGFVMGVGPLLLAFFLATLLGAVIGMIGLAAGFFQRKKPIPFGPFIAAGALISYFYYDNIIDWYLSLLMGF
ncbi:prepilin peptidase [Rossellomorea aquimaris]|uniref:Prepilin peptidase n=1 Tax=Rossellomorea aquimaris TaxID=189382 RepID=A0A5D4UAI0_9BACI|nr:A24 family peptidase [Rossellomorea aquimaris]TYS84049.1 prepilin peptidase [Rossellomorea aquimaris]